MRVWLAGWVFRDCWFLVRIDDTCAVVWAPDFDGVGEILGWTRTTSRVGAVHNFAPIILEVHNATELIDTPPAGAGGGTLEAQ